MSRVTCASPSRLPAPLFDRGPTDDRPRMSTGSGRTWLGMPHILDLVGLPVLGCLLFLSLIRHGRRSELLPGLSDRIWGACHPLPDDRPVVWFHAVSVGEALLCRRVLARLTAARPDLQFVLSVSTADGYAVASRQVVEATVCRAPMDLSWAVRRFLDDLRPQALVIAENDFWPQMLAEARRREVALAIFNTRMSRREQREHRWNAWMLRRGLARARWWGAVSEKDEQWIRWFFGASAPVEVTGSLKFAGILRDRRDAASEQLRAILGFAPCDVVLVAGSTHAPEEQLLASVVRRMSAEFPRLRLVLVPRQASRGPQIARALDQSGAPFERRSDFSHSGAPAKVITLIEATGLLRDLWGIADFAFVGGSLTPHGGQNLAEPAGCGVPMCFGPHVENFQQMAEQFLAAGAAVRVNSDDELLACLRAWLRDPTEAARLGAAAKQVVARQTEALEKSVRGILSILPPPIQTRSQVASAASPSVGEEDQ